MFLEQNWISILFWLFYLRQRFSIYLNYSIICLIDFVLSEDKECSIFFSNVMNIHLQEELHHGLAAVCHCCRLLRLLGNIPAVLVQVPGNHGLGHNANLQRGGCHLLAEPAQDVQVRRPQERATQGGDQRPCCMLI